MKNGKINVNKKLVNVSVGGVTPAYYRIKISAATTDGSGLSDSYTVYAAAPASGCSILDGVHKARKSYTESFPGNNAYFYMYVRSGQVFGNPSCSSSNPEVMSVKYVGYDSSSRAAVYILIAHKKGKAKITFKTTDGSNKKASVSFNMK